MPAPDSSYLYNPNGDTLNNGSTKYVELPVTRDGCIGAQLAWLDATSAATITLELTSYGQREAPYDAAAAHRWKDSGLTITGPAGAAAGSVLVNVENVRQRRARFKIVATANSKIQVLAGIV